ncbi:hypothetical protein FRC02_004134 [Tulasnella sp. 418]|nr:hypothetical protein FRC02_004134 [Tulasnella sp. 418]
MSTVDFESLKRELKVWQRAFRAEHGRDINKEDLKANPAIDAKYALYRQLSKANGSKQSPPASTSNERADEPPSTPRPRRAAPKAKPAPSIYPKSLPESSIVSNVTSNPFSPVKKRIQPNASPIKPQAMRNPFLDSPQRPKSNSKSKDMSNNIFAPIPSSNMFGSSPNRSTLPPSTTPSSATTSTTAYDANSPKKFRDLLSSATSAFRDTPRTKARKRLRGEDVPETPGDKRRRVVRPIRTTTLDADIQENPTVEEDDEESLELTPAKPAIGKATVFRPTFDDAKPGPSAPFSSLVLETKFSTGAPSSKSTIKPSLGKGREAARTHSLKNLFSKGLVASSLSEPSCSGTTDDSDASTSGPKGKEAAKRQRSGVQEDREQFNGPSLKEEIHPSVTNMFGLRPPSPLSVPANSKGKNSKWGDRKKTKVQQPTLEQGDDDPIEIDEPVKELEWKSRGALKSLDAVDPATQGQEGSSRDDDAVLPETDDLVHLYRAKSSRPLRVSSSEEEEDDVQVDLPDEMKKVLVIDSPKKKENEKEIALQALTGKGPGTCKGEEVWIAGETGANDDDELDWESEPEGWTNTVEM